MNIVRELRLRAGMQQKDLAISVGVSRPTVSEWEHNKKDPSGDRLKRLSEIFGVDPGIILGYGTFSDPAQHTETPTSEESRLISNAVDRMSPEDRKRALNVLRAACAEYFDETGEEKMA